MIEKQRLIDAAALIEQIKGITEEWTTDEVIDLLTFAPVIEARPMVHGHWIMQRAAEHPEPRYPTWMEWQKANFPDAQVALFPCNFARCHKNFSGCFECDFYRESAIPADIAQKLGIKPITEERVDK